MGFTDLVPGTPGLAVAPR